jgi:predicted MFS family arabinose efflux permease
VYLAFCPLVGIAVSGCYAPLIGAVGRAFGGGGVGGGVAGDGGGISSSGADERAAMRTNLRADAGADGGDLAGGDVGRRRALAISIVLVGVGAGTLVMPSVCEALVDRYGWRTTFLLVAALGAIVIAATALAASAVAARAPAAPSSSATSAPMWRSPRFRRLYVSVVLIGPGFYAPLAFASDYAVDEGIGSRAAAALIGVMGGSSVAARLAFGSVTERVGPLNLYRLGYLLMLAGLIVWFGAGSSYLLLLTAAVLHGLGWAAWVTATPLVLAGWFGLGSLGGTLGTFYTGLGIGALIGPGVSGFVIDRSGYGLAIALVVLVTAAACALALLPLPESAPNGPRRRPGARSGDAASAR